MWQRVAWRGVARRGVARHLDELSRLAGRARHLAQPQHAVVAQPQQRTPQALFEPQLSGGHGRVALLREEPGAPCNAAVLQRPRVRRGVQKLADQEARDATTSVLLDALRPSDLESAVLGAHL